MSEKTIIKRTFTNPVYPHGADPWVIRDGDSYYYCYSAGNGVNVNKIESPDKITTDGGVKSIHRTEGHRIFPRILGAGASQNRRKMVHLCCG